MAEFAPLTKERREKLIERVRQVGVGTQDDRTILAYEATVKEREQRIAELEVENARLKALLCPFPDTETCDLCGRTMGIGFHVDDETWARLSPTGDGNGALCPWCADRRARELGLTDVPATFFINFDVLRDSQQPYEGAWKQRALRVEAELAALKRPPTYHDVDAYYRPETCETCRWFGHNATAGVAWCRHDGGPGEWTGTKEEPGCDKWESRKEHNV